MLEGKNIFGDNEYTLMAEIADNNEVTQRELSKKMGVSVSTVNLLMNKMIREGLVKMTQVSQRQVLYMLTPVGAMEKAKKTVSYLKAHYKAIYKTRENMKRLLEELILEYKTIYIWIHDLEMQEIIMSSMDEFLFINKQSDIIFAESKQHIDMDKIDQAVLLYMEMNDGDLDSYCNNLNMKRINLAEVLSC